MNTYISTYCSAFYPSGLFWCELQSVGDISRRDVCPILNIIDLNGARLKAPKTSKTQQQCFFTVTTTFFLVNYTHQLCHCRRRFASTHGYKHSCRWALTLYSLSYPLIHEKMFASFCPVIKLTGLVWFILCELKKTVQSLTHWKLEWNLESAALS